MDKPQTITSLSIDEIEKLLKDFMDKTFEFESVLFIDSFKRDTSKGMAQIGLNMSFYPR